MESVPNCRKEIADRYPIRWFKWLKPPKNMKRQELVKYTKNLEKYIATETAYRI